MFAKIKDHLVPFATGYSPGCTTAASKVVISRKGRSWRKWHKEESSPTFQTKKEEKPGEDPSRISADVQEGGTGEQEPHIAFPAFKHPSPQAKPPAKNRISRAVVQPNVWEPFVFNNIDWNSTLSPLRTMGRKIFMTFVTANAFTKNIYTQRLSLLAVYWMIFLFSSLTHMPTSSMQSAEMFTNNFSLLLAHIYL